MIKRLADRLFKWYCHPDYYPDIQGDLEELHQDQLEQFPKSAELKYLKEVIKLCRPALIRPLFKNSLFNSTGMFKNYFKISFRNLVKQKVFSAINITGLAIGLSAFLLINQYVAFEKSYDRFFTDSDRLYRLTTDQIVDGVIGARDAMAFNPAAKTLDDIIPEIIGHTTTYKLSDLTFRKGEQSVNEPLVVAADSNYLQLFDYQVIHGDLASMLSEPYTMVLTKNKAKIYFGDSNPVGQTVELLGNFEKPFKVTGVIQDVPENTHYKFEILLSLSTLQKQLDKQGWNYNNYYSYIKLAPLADIEVVRAKLPPVSDYVSTTSLSFNLQSVESIHLHSDMTYEPEINGSAEMVDFLNIISILILIIAWANYINLTTAKSINRAKEVGLRKTVGANKIQLITQFMIESFLLNFISAFLALMIAEGLYPFFNQLVGKPIITDIWSNRDFTILLVTLSLIGTLVTGLYPSFVLSSFKPSLVLKGKFKTSVKGTLLRKGLVVFQFAASLILVATTLIVEKQISYMLNKEKGLDVAYVVGFKNPRLKEYQGEVLSDKLRQFKQALMSHHAIENAGLTSALPGGDASSIWSTSDPVKINGKTNSLEGTTYLLVCDENFLPSIGAKLLVGRSFDPAIQSDSSSVIINQAFLNRYGLKNASSVLGDYIQFGEDIGGNKYRIVGVVGDYHRSSFKASLEPTAMFFTDRTSKSVVRLNKKNYDQGLDHLEQTWSQYFPNAPFSYTFLDQKFETLYEEDKRFGYITSIFSVLAIFIASLGLFGLSAFMATQRSKEVGIRKVLGASIPQILIIFYREFVVLIGLSAAVGIPLVYFTMDNWLNNYAYRVTFPWIFVGAAIILVIASALLTVGYQTIRVAIKNPSETLRYE
ncbi:putative ABC transport system permease protein [Reichenbachiella faecimaris]|uniref:Putative ABC transport system permease protein n=1 Tax=Reichenbachiella faecimaris TaxID=692418 RepID=A0A1W2GHU6_REIFA|nr:ABC transporter permease [Reichenbachiella faecimaris]SMD36233.1 putative ABC transport system permease protein [Reichenbachiella faecimaris]